MKTTATERHNREIPDPKEDAGSKTVNLPRRFRVLRKPVKNVLYLSIIPVLLQWIVDEKRLRRIKDHVASIALPHQE